MDGWVNLGEAREFVRIVMIDRMDTVAAPDSALPPQPPPAGWYNDQTDPATQRWWDGTRWTEHTQASHLRG